MVIIVRLRVEVDLFITTISSILQTGSSSMRYLKINQPYSLISFFGILTVLLLPFANRVYACTSQTFDWTKTQQEVSQILRQYEVPGAAIAIVGVKGIEWYQTYGLADIESQTPVQTHSRFRIGSVSKMFISLAIMKLVEQGKIELLDNLSVIAPEIHHSNPWQESNPVKIVDLLAHTTGWDGPHFVENAQNHADPISTYDAVQFHPHTRHSRWVPGTRTAYNNSAIVVAAYIVEKLSGITFESFVEKHFFVPLNMTHSSYFYTDTFRQNAVSLYRGMKKLPYRHLNNRASGGLNSSLSDMSKFAHWLIKTDKQGLLTERSLASIRHNVYSLPSQSGLELNWGLGSQVFRKNGYLFFGHEGSLRGSHALLAYQPELKVAHIILVNTNGPALSKIHDLLTEKVTAEHPKKAIKNIKPLTEMQKALAGYYQSASPISKIYRIGQLFSPLKLSINGESLIVKPLLGGIPRILFNNPKGQLIEPTSGKVAMVKAQDPIIGEVLHYGPTALVKISALSAWFPIMLSFSWLIANVSSVLFMFVWLPRLILRRVPLGPALKIRLLPAIHGLLIGVLTITLINIQTDLFPEALLGNVSWQSLAIFVISCGIGLTSTLSFWPLLMHWKQPINRVLYWHSMLVSIFNVIFTVLLAMYGLLGIASWVV